MQNKIKNKKGLSGIVATFTIILISLVGLSILAAATYKLTKKVELSPEVSCVDIKIQKPVEMKEACYNKETKNIEIKIKRNLNNLKINSIEFSSNSEKWQCGKTCNNCIILENGETKTYYLESEEKPEYINLKAENCLISNIKIKNCGS